jgi:hypothetical protein
VGIVAPRPTDVQTSLIADNELIKEGNNMGRGATFWAVILIVAGTLLLLGNLGIINVNVWGVIWPLLLIALGLFVLWGVFFGQSSVEAEEATIPLEGATEARIRVNHGAGRLHVEGGAGSTELLAGTFGGGLTKHVRRDGNRLDVEMRLPIDVFPSFIFPWIWGTRNPLDWSFSLNGDVPLTLRFETGAGEAHLDLSSLLVTELRLETGASSTDITLPANAGYTKAKINAGAASAIVRVPPGVAARIRASGGLASINVDRERFPHQGDVCQSPDYNTALNKVDLTIDTGVGSISVR